MDSNQFFIINKDTTFYLDHIHSTSVNHAMNMILRDMKKVFNYCITDEKVVEDATVHIRYAKEVDDIYGEDERFMVKFIKRRECYKLNIIGSDDLGIVYGLLFFSEKYLGIDPFWFWAELEPEKKEEIRVPIEDYVSPIPRVRYRGWFVNDEVCLIGWANEYPPPKEVWHPVFETLLRCGGNMVIPGTDLPKTGIHWDLASEMGLWITQHHAEPLGAEMFLRAYPHEEASYSKHPDLYEQLWRQAVIKQKDKKVVWTLGFRGQGDCPFWEQDPAFDTPEKRGQLISSVLGKQYNIVCEHVEDPVFCTNIYGELAELYKQGVLEIPEGVIKIWADNGYGKMVSRRQNNEDYRIPTLPTKNDEPPHGLYYHITFHDLQASNHLTMLPLSPQFIKNELEQAFKSKGDELLLLNSGNIRMHIYMLSIVSKIWQEGSVDINNFDKKFFKTYFPSSPNQVAECYHQYFDTAIQYGEYEDNKAGDEFYHHPARIMACEWIKGDTEQTIESLLWATGKMSFKDQVMWFKDKCETSIKGWKDLKEKCINILDNLNPREKLILCDYLLLQIELHLTGCKGFTNLCNGYLAFENKDEYPMSFIRAFVSITKAMREYDLGVQALEAAEHDQWKNFYSADYLTNVRLTVSVLDTLRKYIRVLGDSPDFFYCYKHFLMPKTERNIYLENTQRRVLSDDELADRLMKEFNL